jgi:hypothetical protein
MPRVSIEMFSASGKFAGRVSRQTASRLVEEGSARWIAQGYGRRCLRKTADTSRHSAPSLGVRDMEVSAGIIGSFAEERAVRHRVMAWAPREATS